MALTARGPRGATSAGPALAAQIGQVLAGSEPVRGVLSLLALAEEPLAAYPAVAAGLVGTLALVQALGDAGVGVPLWALTRGAVAAGPGDGAVSPSRRRCGAWGGWPALEHPERWGGLVDLPAVLDEQAAARLCGVLAAGGRIRSPSARPGVVARRLSRAGPPVSRHGTGWTPRGTRAGHRRDRGDRRARGPLASHPRCAPGRAGQPVRPGRRRRWRPWPPTSPQRGPRCDVIACDVAAAP